MSEARIEEAEKHITFLVGKCHKINLMLPCDTAVIIAEIAQRQLVGVESE